ncbi:hypothetical protein PR048_024332 [Dryococelus australis]|uniref:Uncharacterized protein n=1 Tax=Dryococelus australis TaxID=614101 RepID=A0ABQ9GNB6_9NEOP|nr:hypothetical protein PR048_024332 [Dryococelus australis]
MKVKLCLWLCQRRRLKIVVVFFGVSTCVGLLCELVSDEGASEATAEPQWTATSGENSAAVTQAFLAGGYMRDTRPANVSHCRYNYGAPAQLLFDASSASHSPGGGAAGPYRVLYNVVQGDPGTAALTYCTHATPELLWHVTEVVRRWDGPVSLAVFAPLGDAALCLQLVDRLCRCSPRMSALSLHLVFPARAPPLVPDPAVTPLPPEEDCAAPNLPALTARHQLGLTYPVNVARNAARTAASTRHVLVSDVELLPSQRLAAGFTALWARLGQVRLASARHVFVVPVFEVERSEEVPATKQQLVWLYAHGRAVYFHRWVCLHCQRFPGLQRWLHRKPRPHLQVPCPAPMCLSQPACIECIHHFI